MNKVQAQGIPLPNKAHQICMNFLLVCGHFQLFNAAAIYRRPKHSYSNVSLADLLIM